jgi:hypothetical protein
MTDRCICEVVHSTYGRLHAPAVSRLGWPGLGRCAGLSMHVHLVRCDIHLPHLPVTDSGYRVACGVGHHTEDIGHEVLA